MTLCMGYIPSEWAEKRGRRRVTYDRDAWEKFGVFVLVLEDTGEVLQEVRGVSVETHIDCPGTLTAEFVLHKPYVEDDDSDA